MHQIHTYNKTKEKVPRRSFFLHITHDSSSWILATNSRSPQVLFLTDWGGSGMSTTWKILPKKKIQLLWCKPSPREWKRRERGAARRYRHQMWAGPRSNEVERKRSSGTRGRGTTGTRFIQIPFHKICHWIKIGSSLKFSPILARSSYKTDFQNALTFNICQIYENYYNIGARLPDPGW